MQQLSLSLMEIIVLMAGAITLGITIHFFIVSRKNLRNFSFNPDQKERTPEEWKLRYFNDIEKKDQALNYLKKEIEQLTEKNSILNEEAEEMKFRMKKSEQAVPPVQHTADTISGTEYLENLRLTQKGLFEQNERIAALLEQIDHIREQEGNKNDLRLENEELAAQVEELKERLTLKEKEIDAVRQQSQLSKEMSSMLDNAYHEFNVLQEKILKLETQVSSSQRINMEYEDLKEGFFKASKDLEEQRSRLNELLNENRQLQAELADATENLHEANFQRQQLQKRVAYLEEMNQDLQAVADANRKLESQLKRIGELESLLNVMSEERNEISR